MKQIIPLPNKRLVWYLALEEYLAERVSEEQIFFWVVPPTVIFGRHQVMENEVNLDYCRRNGVQFYRRKSGGGCVYADSGNLMISYITPDTHSEAVFQRYLDLFVSALSTLGYPAVKSEHNDILVSGRKVSGNACYALPTGSIVHGTMLWDVDFARLPSSYPGHMLLLHGDRDSTVPISWSEHAKEIIPDCEYYVIQNGGHEFFGQPFEDAMSYILPYLDTQLNRERTESEENEPMLQMKIGDTEVAVDWEDNESVEALKELCREEPLTISMSMYGGFEQVGSIGQSLPRNDRQTTTQAGDIVLYSGSQIVVFYGSNSWAYTRLGHITDKSAQEIAELLGGGDVTITIG